MSADHCYHCDGRGEIGRELCDACEGTGLEPREIDDVWTCSCGLTRPMTGSYGCPDCGDGRPPMLVNAETEAKAKAIADKWAARFPTIIDFGDPR